MATPPGAVKLASELDARTRDAPLGMSAAPILFLDFDGVLHVLNCATERRFTSLPLLEDVLREFPELRIVVSSNWREAHGLDQLRSLFAPDIAARVIGVTPVLAWVAGVPHRYAECSAWLRANAPGAKWLAIDDDPALFEPRLEQLLACDPRLGLTRDQLPELRRRIAALCELKN